MMRVPSYQAAPEMLEQLTDYVAKILLLVH
jgi:hypothetical protein